MNILFLLLFFKTLQAVIKYLLAGLVWLPTSIFLTVRLYIANNIKTSVRLSNDIWRVEVTKVC